MLFAIAGQCRPEGEQMKLSSMATCLNLILLFAGSSACSQLVANTGISSVDELRDGRNRNQVRAQYGTPVSSTTLPTGREVETYRVTKQLGTVFSALSDRSWVSRQEMTGSQVGKSALVCVLLGPGCLYIATAVVVNETFSLPVNLVRSQMNQIEAAFVFGGDEELLYVYEADGDPSTKFSQALRPCNIRSGAKATVRAPPSASVWRNTSLRRASARKKSGTRSASRTSRASSRICRRPKASMQESLQSRRP